MMPSEAVTYQGTCWHGVVRGVRCLICQPDTPSPAVHEAGWVWPSLPPPPAWGFRFVPTACEHCFCMPLGEWDHAVTKAGDHEQCCNCGVRRLKDPQPVS
jgi:hypothetical protein